MNYVITGAGVFQLNLRLLNGQYPQPQNYSLSPDEEVVVEVTLNSTMSNITVVINRCWVTETNNPDGTPYTFLENRFATYLPRTLLVVKVCCTSA